MLAKERALWGTDYADHGLLFCWEDGRPPHPDTFTTRFNRLAGKAALPKIRLHDVRHTYATAARRAKIDWKALSQRIGHSSVSFTMQTYVQSDPDVDRAAVHAVAALILNGVPHRRKIGENPAPDPP